MEVCAKYFKKLLMTASQQLMKKFRVRELGTSAKVCIMNSCFTRCSKHCKDDLKEKHLDLQAQGNQNKKISINVNF